MARWSVFAGIPRKTITAPEKRVRNVSSIVIVGGFVSIISI